MNNKRIRTISADTTGKIVKACIKFYLDRGKIYEKAYWWYFNIPKDMLVSYDVCSITITPEIEDEMKEALMDHTFANVRYQAEFNPSNITFDTI